MGNMIREQNELDGYNQRPGLDSQMSSMRERKKSEVGIVKNLLIDSESGRD